MAAEETVNPAANEIIKNYVRPRNPVAIDLFNLSGLFSYYRPCKFVKFIKLFIHIHVECTEIFHTKLQWLIIDCAVNRA